MRYFWKGTISFGLINIPVGLYAASRDHDLSFKLLHKDDLSEIRYARICKEEEKEVPYQQIVKGIEKNGHYVVLSEDDFKKAEGPKSRAIEIVNFCDEDEIDSIYYEKPYFLKADKGGAKAYFLLLQALSKAKKVAVVRYTLKNHHYVAVIKPYKNILMLNQMRFHNQLVEIDDADIAKTKASALELSMASKLVEQLSSKFKPEQFHDTYVEDLKKVISKKGKGTKVKVVEKEENIAKVYDIMTLLKASLDKKKKAPSPARGRGVG